MYVEPALTYVTISANKTRQVAKFLPRRRDNFIKLFQWQRKVIFEAITVDIDQGVGDSLAHQPNVAHFARLVGRHAIDHQRRFHSLLEKIVELFLIVILIAAGGFYQHVEWELSQWRSVGFNDYTNKS